jgi:hypothetical protein
MLLDAIANALVVSLHAVEGLETKNSMVIYVTIKGEHLLALLDTSSTHNFIQGATLQHLDLTASGGDQLRVMVANGDRLPCVGIARGMEVSIARAPYTITCVSIDLSCFDFILSVEFLCTLGTITWDFDARTLVFQCDGRQVVWRAAPGLGASLPPTSSDPCSTDFSSTTPLSSRSRRGSHQLDRMTTAYTSCRVPPVAVRP